MLRRVQPAQPLNQPLPRFEALDGVRGLAILMVLLGHTMVLPEQAGHRFTVIAGAVRNLWVGVDLFFVLSGFLITGILLATRDSPNYLRSFYIRRVLRIFPLYYATLIAFFLIAPRLPQYAGAELTFEQTHKPWWFLYAGNFVVNRYGVLPMHLAHFWSLAVEEHFYLVWPLIVLLAGRRSLWWICIAAITMATGLRIWLLMRGWFLPQLATPCRIDALAVGALIAIEYKNGRLDRLLKPAVWMLAPLALLSALLLFPTGEDALTFEERLTRFTTMSLAFTALALTFGAVVVIAVAVAPRSITGRTLGNPLLRFFGKYSYAIYCFHPLLIPLLLTYAHPTRLTAHAGRPIVGLSLFAIIVVAVSTALAYLSWHLFEKRFLRLKRFFTYDRNS